MRLPYRGHGLRLAGLTLCALLLGGIATRAQEKTSDGAQRGGGLYVAVGYGGRRISSPDGARWTNDVEWAADGGDDDNCLFSVVFAQGKFVATGGGASVGHVLITPDGKTWREVFTARTRVVPVLYGGGKFVAGCGRDLLVSPDAEHWQTGATLPYERGLYFRRGAYGNGVFVLCGDCDIAPGQPRGGWVATTRDGKALVKFDTSLPNTRSLAFGAGRFVLVGEHGYRATSADGKTWQATSDPKEDFRWVFYTGKQFLLGGNALYTSPDGLSWTKIEGGVPCEPQCRGESGFLGASWKTNLWQSADALHWRKVSDAGTNAFTSIAYGRLDPASPRPPCR